MNKTIIWIIVAIVVVGGAFVLFGGEKDPEVASSTADDNVSGELTIRNLMASGDSLQCSLSRQDDQSTVVGTVLIDGERVRGDFEITTSISEAASFVTHFIVTGGETYTWTSLSNVGFKSAVVDNNDTVGDAVGLDEAAEYSCYPWAADSASFRVPSGINFQEV